MQCLHVVLLCLPEYFIWIHEYAFSWTWECCLMSDSKVFAAVGNENLNFCCLYPQPIISRKIFMEQLTHIQDTLKAGSQKFDSFWSKRIFWSKRLFETKDRRTRNPLFTDILLMCRYHSSAQCSLRSGERDTVYILPVK